jgi:hypothetical protein
MNMTIRQRNGLHDASFLWDNDLNRRISAGKELPHEEDIRHQSEVPSTQWRSKVAALAVADHPSKRRLRAAFRVSGSVL